MDINEMMKIFLLILIAGGIWFPYFCDGDDCE
jgi:hypothetical protein